MYILSTYVCMYAWSLQKLFYYLCTHLIWMSGGFYRASGPRNFRVSRGLNSHVPCVSALEARLKGRGLSLASNALNATA